MAPGVASLADNPFAGLTLLVAPAIFANASSVLALGTSNRLARVVDRARQLASGLAGQAPASAPDAPLHSEQLSRVEARVRLLLRAMRASYLAISAFSAAGFVSVVGAGLSPAQQPLVFTATLVTGFATGGLGLFGLVSGCALLAWETRLAVVTLGAEAELVWRRGLPLA